MVSLLQPSVPPSDASPKVLKSTDCLPRPCAGVPLAGTVAPERSTPCHSWSLQNHTVVIDHERDRQELVEALQNITEDPGIEPCKLGVGLETSSDEDF